jgi:formylmethanofuran dehydrogenase subunit D
MMENVQHYIISSNQYSMFHKSGKPALVASKGEKVKLIAEHGDILIVENSNKDRFSVNVKFIIELKNSTNNG